MKLISIYNSLKETFFSTEKKRLKQEIISFKTDIWQTEDVSKAFVRGTDSNEISGAYLMDKEINDFFLSNCTLNDKVLDIGCGHGIVSEFMAENGISMTAVDISDELLKIFRNRIENKNLPIKIMRGNAYEIPCSNEEFDVVVARMFLPHFPDWPVVLKEMARVTKKGGKILVHFNSKENTVLGKKLGVKECDIGTSTNYSNPWVFSAEADDKELNKEAKSIGLKVISRTPISFFIHNRIFGYQLGTKQHNLYLKQIKEYFKDEKIRDFALWFGKEVITNCSPALSHSNIITFVKQ